MEIERRILIVDDEPAIVELLSMAFLKAGYEVREAHNGVEAMAAFSACNFDIVVSDVNMPQGNGHDVAKWVSHNCPGTRIVLMTGYDLHCDDCPLVPRCAILRKPFRVSEVVEIVDKLLSDLKQPR